ncbi:hypothetical protein [Methanobrevibacter filiformis]|uniref:Uncharacterized protein n=1 Tax=Methanobrevibacter filiformis TaxID=55758 RepID=A0A166F5A7_9EURY|nr:hypothetical protein [Methanobrevibacter filiformis]KZX17330.1 hypothetical protein MBFIL_02230 [Methanobrevibacter filiformis]
MPANDDLSPEEKILNFMNNTISNYENIISIEYKPCSFGDIIHEFVVNVEKGVTSDEYEKILLKTEDYCEKNGLENIYEKSNITVIISANKED